MPNSYRNILVTGGAGFIGSHFVELLLQHNYLVTIIDNFDPFYSREIKESNIKEIKQHPNVVFYELDICDQQKLEELPGNYDAIVHFAAKAGVRPSIKNPLQYQEVNVKGTQHLLEFARRRNITQFIFASSSSVYGVNKNYPWNESDGLLYPISPYASTKISAELLGHVYSHLYNIRFIALRFFTVFGPRQRPDLAIHLFSKKIINGEPIDFFGDGNTKRDYTYVSDIVKGVFNALQYDKTNYEIINLGNCQTISLKEMLETIEDVFEKKATLNFLPEQMGDVSITCADIKKAKDLIQYEPGTSFRNGVENFKSWFLQQHGS